MNTKISSLPPRLRTLALKRTEEYRSALPVHSRFSDMMDPAHVQAIDADKDLQVAFSWMTTVEGAKFWALIYLGDHQPFYDMYGYDKGYSEVANESECKQKRGETTERMAKMFVGLSQALNEIVEAKRKAAAATDHYKNAAAKTSPVDDEFKNGESVYLKEYDGSWTPGTFVGMNGKYFVADVGRCVNNYSECRKVQPKEAAGEDKNVFKADADTSSLYFFNRHMFSDLDTFQVFNSKDDNVKEEYCGRSLYVHPGLDVKFGTTKGGGTVIAILKK